MLNIKHRKYIFFHLYILYYLQNEKYSILDKVLSGGAYSYTPNQCYCLFSKSTKYVALTLKIAVICYNNTTLKEFCHAVCEAHDPDGTGAGIMLNQTLDL